MTEFVMYVGGGAMSAVFSAGVLAELHKLGVKDKISALHAVSAGAFNAALFLSDRPQLATSWYTKTVHGKGIIKTLNPWKVIRGEEALDLDVAENEMIKEKLIDLDLLKNSQIPFFIKVLNTKTKNTEYLDVKEVDILRALRATATLVPFVKEQCLLNGECYVDGAMGEPIGLDRLREIYPGAKFIVILNSSFEMSSLRKYLLWIISYAREEPILNDYLAALILARQEFLTIKNAPDVILFAPPDDFPVTPLTEEEEILQKGFDAGVEAVKKAISELENNSLVARS